MDKEKVNWEWFDEAIRLWAPYFYSKRKANKSDWKEIHKIVEFSVEYYMKYDLLQSQTQDIKKNVKGMKKDYENREISKEGFFQQCSYLECKCLGYNKALEDVIKILE